MLAVRSGRVMAAAFKPKSAREKRDREMLLFHLEEHLAIGAEETVADFVVADDHVLAVAVREGEYLPLVRALENLGLQVQSISPASMLLAQELWNELSPPPDFVIFPGTDGDELFQFRDQKPANWWFRPASPGGSFDEFAAAVSTAVLAEAGSIRVAVVGQIPDWPAELCEEIELVPHDFSSPLAALYSGVHPIATGRRSVWFELRRDGLCLGDPLREIRTPLRLFAASLFLLLIVIGAGLLARANHYERRMVELHDEQKVMFAQALPSSRVPSGGILSRLRSEVRTMRGARERRPDVELAKSAVVVLQQFLQSLPAATRFQIRQATIENGAVDIDLTVRSFADVNALMGSLQQQGFTMLPPSSSQQDERTVVSRLVGKYTEADQPAEPVTPDGDEAS